MILGVVGSREGIAQHIVFMVLENFQKANLIDRIISGGARGVDSYAKHWAQRNNVDIVVHRAKWDLHGKQAGAIRNQIIVDQCDQMMVFWNGKSPGTLITLKMAEKARKPFHLIGTGKPPVDPFNF